jgi:drug/metabolite transporter (DMT)-like permease
MTGAVGAGLALALGSAAALNWAFFRQHGAASTMPPLSVRRPLQSLLLLARSPSWLAGFLVGLGGWALYVGALRLAPLSLVQAASAGGIGLLALLVARTGQTTLTRREWLGAAAAVAGLALLALSLAGGTSAGVGAPWAAVALWVGVSLVLAALVALRGAARLAGGAGLGIAAGVLYAAGDVATKAAVGGGAAIAFAAVVLACHGLGFVALQLGFQRGSALATAGVSTLLTNALPILAGTTVFGEGLPDGRLGAVRVAAFLAVVAGAVALARPEPEHAQPTSAARAASTSSSVL